MARAKVISEDDWERTIQIANGDIIVMRLEEDWSQITFWSEKGKQLGKDEDFVFYQDEGPHDFYLLARMYVPVKHNGIGRAALEFFLDRTGGKVYTRLAGMNPGDGSHLTEDAPGFVMKMQEEKLISNSEYYG